MPASLLPLWRDELDADALLLVELVELPRDDALALLLPVLELLQATKKVQETSAAPRKPLEYMRPI